MACYHPITGYRGRKKGANGKVPIVFNTNEGYYDQIVMLPCYRCIGCKLERSRQWAIRCVHEASLHNKNCYITLTYNDENLPKDNSVDITHFQKFMKRLRKKYTGHTIRMFHCGEYGEDEENESPTLYHHLGRPHYHAILFNFDFPDRKFKKLNQNGDKLYTSNILHNPDKPKNSLWPNGYCWVGDVTFQSAAYVARYIIKKITGDDSEEHYKGRKPEYITMSRGNKTELGGIGSQWLKKYKGDVYPSDYIILNDKKYRPPKYYDYQYSITNKEEHDKIKLKRINNSIKHEDNNTHERLVVREKVQQIKAKQLIRKDH